MNKIPITREGFSKMESDLHKMRYIDLKECLQNLTDARDKGDISENAEYNAAKQALDELNMRINKTSNILSNAEILEGIIDDGTVQILTWVKFKNLKSGDVLEYRIVPESDIDIKLKKISHNSPIGKSLMNKKVGEVCSFDVPAGKMEVEILDIRVK